MKVKRYEIMEYFPGQWRTIDHKEDDFVCIPLTTDSKEDMEEIMGEDMEEEFECH